MKNLKKIVSVLFSATTTSSVAIDKLHFVIGGGAGGGSVSYTHLRAHET